MNCDLNNVSLEFLIGQDWWPEANYGLSEAVLDFGRSFNIFPVFIRYDSCISPLWIWSLWGSCNSQNTPGWPPGVRNRTLNSSLNVLYCQPPTHATLPNHFRTRLTFPSPPQRRVWSFGPPYPWCLMRYRGQMRTFADESLPGNNSDSSFWLAPSHVSSLPLFSRCCLDLTI